MVLPRVTDADVKTILDTTIDTTPFTVTAHCLVEETLYPLGTLSEARLTQIELYLSAHFACTMDPRITKEKIGDGENTYQLKADTGLNGTTYGQQAAMLDTTGKLMNMTAPKAFLETI